MALVEFTSDSPERGWPPFLNWMKEQGIERSYTYQLDVDTEKMTALVYRHARNAEGHAYLGSDGEKVNDPPFEVTISSLPPLNRLEERRPW